MNTAAFLAKQARQRPDQVAIRHASESITYQRFYDRALAFGGTLPNNTNIAGRIESMNLWSRPLAVRAPTD